jgi:hypothetical protein
VLDVTLPVLAIAMSGGAMNSRDMPYLIPNLVSTYYICNKLI